jgi:hypothetical protein
MAKEHGLHRIAHELRVDHYGLKRRLERAGGVARGGRLDTQFVDLFAAPAATAAGMRECVVELENARGAKMRVELNDNGLAGLAGLCSAFWSDAGTQARKSSTFLPPAMASLSQRGVGPMPVQLLPASSRYLALRAFFSLAGLLADAFFAAAFFVTETLALDSTVGAAEPTAQSPGLKEEA